MEVIQVSRPSLNGIAKSKRALSEQRDAGANLLFGQMDHGGSGRVGTDGIALFFCSL